MKLLRATNITFGYNPDAPVISDFSAEIDAGEMVALTGPSGRGKSTLLYVLGLLLNPQKGEIEVCGHQLSGAKDKIRAFFRAEIYGFVFQDAALDPTRTVLDNVMESSLYRQQVDPGLTQHGLELLDRFNVAVRANHKPGQISGGQAQRIALARALLGNPKLVLADEPTGNLDDDAANVVLDALRNHACAGAGVIIATHDHSVLSRCDRRIQL